MSHVRQHKSGRSWSSRCCWKWRIWVQNQTTAKFKRHNLCHIRFGGSRYSWKNCGNWLKETAKPSVWIWPMLSRFEGLRHVTLFWLVLLQCEMNWGIDLSTNTTVPISYTSLNIAGILYQVCLLSTHTVMLQSLFNKNCL